MRRHIASLLVMVMMVALWPVAAAAADDVPVPVWHWRNPLPQGISLSDVAYGNGRWVALGRGTVLTSTDGKTWSVAPGSSEWDYELVAFGHGLFVASANGKIATSKDGLAWTTRHTYNGPAVTGIAYGNDRWVAIGGGTSYVSADGVTWKGYLASSEAGSPVTIAFGDGQFVAVTTGGKLMASADGMRWNQPKLAVEGELLSIAHGNGRFVAGGLDGLTLTSEDGVAWEQGDVPIPESYPGDRLARLIFDGRRFLAIIRTAWGTALAASDEGVVWERLTPHQFPTLSSLAAGDGQLIAVGMGGIILGSTDGTAWTPRTGGTFANLEAVAAGNGVLVAVGWSESTGVIFTSSDGVNWTPRHNGQGQFRDVVFGGGRFLAITSGAFHRSVDGIHWEVEPYGSAFAPLHLAYGNGTFVAVGNGGTALVSEDGEVWAVGRLPAEKWVHGLAFGDGLFAAVSEDGAFTSSDGLVWTKEETAGVTRLMAVAFGQGRFMAVGANAVLLRAAKEKTWTRQTGAAGMTPGEITGLTHTADGFVAGSYAGSIFRWNAGRGWLPWAENLNGVVVTDFARVDAKMIAVGHSGVILSTGGKASAPSYTETRRRPDPARSQVTADRTFVPPDDRSTATVTVTLLDRDDKPVAGQVVAVRRHASDMGIAPRAAVTDGQGQATFTLQNRRPETVRYWVELPGENLVLVQGVTINFATCAGRFPDVDTTDPFCQPIEEMAARKVIGGFPDGTFRPDGGLTRAELAKMLTVYLGKEPRADGVLPHTDVAGHWAYVAGYLQAVEAVGAMTGYPDGSFQPDRPVTRAELIKAVMVAGQLPTGGYLSYSDVSGDAWYSGWAAGASRAGVIGITARWPVLAEGTLKPDQGATRAEAAVLLANLWDRMHP